MDTDQGKGRQTLVVGAGGGIGGAMVRRWAADPAVDRVWAVSRSPGRFADLGERVVELQADHSEEGIAATLETAMADGVGLSRVVIALGTLHSAAYEPEKSLDALRADVLAEVYRVNCILPLLWVAGLGRALRKSPDTRIAVLSARVGSIGDNGLGGWYAYRSSKAALNMGLKCAAIELGRRARGLKLMAYHPGTVDTSLSEPFQKNVPADRLFTPQFTAGCLDGLLTAHAPDGELSFVAGTDRRFRGSGFRLAAPLRRANTLVQNSGMVGYHRRHTRSLPDLETDGLAAVVNPHRDPQE